MQENFGLLLLGMSLSFFPFLSHHSLEKQKRIFCMSTSIAWIELLQFLFRRKKSQLKPWTTIILRGRKETKQKKTNHTKKNKTKRMSFHTFYVHCLKWGIFWWGMRSCQGRISSSLESPEVTTMTKSSFFFLLLPLLQPAYALSSWKNK